MLLMTNKKYIKYFVLSFAFVLTGIFKDIYNDYKYTYIGSGIFLLLASIFLFIGMGVNYRLQDKELKNEATIVQPTSKDEFTTNKESSNEVVTVPDASKSAE